ncbi:unnamed protein product [Zymoseptoria tritici ST99CH_3D1]|nr:unnamed protein product [Zymoseptoria tritici ST99CH_3D1]
MPSIPQSPPARQTRGLTFEDLPPEIRNLVYVQLLSRPAIDAVVPVHTVHSVRADLADDEFWVFEEQDRWDEADACRDEFERMEAVHKDTEPWKKLTIMTAPDSQALHPQLLAVSRFIQAETTPILYGINRLEITWHHLERFLKQCGPSVQHIRKLYVDVECSVIQQNFVRSIEKALLPAKRLQWLIIAAGARYSNPNKVPRTMPRKMAQLLKSWASRLMKARMQSNDREGRSTSQVAATFRFAGFENAEAYTSEVSKSLLDLLDKAKHITITEQPTINMSLVPPVLRTERKSALTFEDLPPEIRNEIYELALTSPDGVEIRLRLPYNHADVLRRWKALKESGNYPEARDLLCQNGVDWQWAIAGIYLVDLDTRKDLRIPLASPWLSSPLLAVSKLVNKEATPVLYGMNRFQVRAEEFGHISAALGFSIKHVRPFKVMVSSAHHEHVKSITKLLSTATSLQDVEFVSLKHGKANSSPKNMAGHLRIWATRAIKARAEGEDGKASSPREIAEIIRFSGQVKVEDYTAQVQKALVEILEEPKPARTTRKKT